MNLIVISKMSIYDELALWHPKRLLRLEMHRETFAEASGVKRYKAQPVP